MAPGTERVQGAYRVVKTLYRFKLTSNILFMFILYLIMFNCILVLWVGLYWQ